MFVSGWGCLFSNESDKKRVVNIYLAIFRRMNYHQGVGNISGEKGYGTHTCFKIKALLENNQNVFSSKRSKISMNLMFKGRKLH